MKHHLRDAERHIERAMYGNSERSQFNALLAIAHALIAIAERLPLPAEPPSVRVTQVREADRKREQGEDSDEL